MALYWDMNISDLGHDKADLSSNSPRAFLAPLGTYSPIQNQIRIIPGSLILSTVSMVNRP